MKMNYYPDTDSLYIDMSDKPIADSKVISNGVVLDYGKDGQLVGIDLDNASKIVDLQELVLNRLPLQKETIVA